MNSIRLFMFFALLKLNLFGQKFRNEEIVSDYDFDRINDTIVFSYNENGGCEYVDYHLSKSLSGTISKGEESSSFIDLIPIPKTWDIKGGKLKKMVEKKLFKPFTKLNSSPCVEWLFDIIENKQQEEVQNFYYSSQFKKRYFSELKVENKPCYIEIKCSQRPQIFRTLSIDTNLYSSIWVLYYPNNHFQQKVRSIKCENSDTLLLLTSHGVCLKDNKGVFWLFISDSKATSAPEKLRNESIQKVLYRNNMVFILQKIPSKLYVVDLKNNNLKGVKLENNDGRLVDFFIEKNNSVKLIYENGNQKNIKIF